MYIRSVAKITVKCANASLITVRENANPLLKNQ